MITDVIATTEKRFAEHAQQSTETNNNCFCDENKAEEYNIRWKLYLHFKNVKKIINVVLK